jgi:beta-glucosidase
MDRRDILLAGLALGGSATTGASTNALAPMPNDGHRFPDDFRWGCATAAYQIEGAVKEDGRGETNWDVYSHTPGKIVDGNNGDVACDSYHRYREDTQLLKELGANAYRMSIAWARIFPAGRGQPNQKGVDHYNRVIDNLLENGIQPYVTLFHWDLPTALTGGWQSRDTAKAYADYAGFMARKLGDRVRQFITINEFVCYTDLSYKTGKFAPGLKLPDKEVIQIRHHGVLAHGLGMQAIRANVGRDVRVGLADNPKYCVPVIETPEHIAAARRAMRRENAPFLTAVMEGKYLDSYLEAAGANAPQVLEGDMQAIGSPVDFVGLNVYAPDYVRADAAPAGYALIPHLATSPRMVLPWLYVGPEVLYWAVRHTSELWKPKSIYISENGCTAGDTLAAGRVDDADRIMYLRNCMMHLQRAVAEHYPIRGYFLWSLLDNFEWAEGFSARFGIHYTDYATQRRIPKLSAAWYRELIARGALV